MGEAERYMEHRRPRERFRLGQSNNAVSALLVLHVVFFLTLFVVKVVYNYYQQSGNVFMAEALTWFSMPADLKTFSERPWTLFTFMFTESYSFFFRFLVNLAWMATFGYYLQQMAGNDKIIPVFLYGGITAGLAYVLTATVTSGANLPAFGLFGANVGILALAAAATTLQPRFRIFENIRNGIPLWILTAVYFVIDFISIQHMPAAIKVAHLMAAAAGFLFVYLMRKGLDGSIWMNRFYNWLSQLFNPMKKTSRQRRKGDQARLFYREGVQLPFKKTPLVTQERIDEILDKINQKGYHFLTEEEKNILKRAAESDE